MGFESPVLFLIFRSIMELTFWNIVFVFLSTLLVDIVWAYYFIKIAQKQPVQAGILSILIALTSAYVTISYVHNPLFLIPVGLGAYIGTYYAVKKHKNSENELESKVIELEKRIKYLEKYLDI